MSVYLGRKGQIFGPLSDAQWDALKASGEASNYTYIWDPRKDDWRPLEMAPPRPDGAVRIGARGKSLLSSDLEALCHDQRAVVAGSLAQVGEGGCELLSSQQSDAPLLVEKSRLLLNLLSPKSGKTAQVRVRLTHAIRRDGHWVYRLNWDQVPTLA